MGKSKNTQTNFKKIEDSLEEKYSLFQYMQAWHYVTHKQIWFELKSSREDICTLLSIISLKKNIFYSSHIKIAYTKKYITQKLINQFLDQVQYPI